MATGSTAVTCNALRVIPANPNAHPNAKIYLTETWARPDMVYAHKITTADTTSPTGSPIVDTTSAGGAATLHYTSLASMTADLHTSFADEAAVNSRFAGVLPVGDAFQRAYDQGLVKTGGFYDASGVFVPNAAGDEINLWWDDDLHASKYGSYLDALVQFGMVPGIDPLSLGAGEQAAFDLGISSADALMLERVASSQLAVAAAVPEPSTWALTLGGLAPIGWGARRR